MGVGNVLKEVRGKESQLHLSMDLNVSRETISAYETGRVEQMPLDISQKLMQKYDSPWLAMEASHEYTAGSDVKKLDGQNIDLHRSSVKAKTEEELQEALTALKEISVVNKPEYVEQADRERIKEALIQVIDAIYAAKHLVAVLAKEYGFSWLKLWQLHFKKLLSRGYVRG